MTSDCVFSTSSVIITCNMSGEEFAFRLDRLILSERRSARSIALPFARLSVGLPFSVPFAAAGARLLLLRVSGSPSPPSSSVSWDFLFLLSCLRAPFELVCVFVDGPSCRVPALPCARSWIILGCITKPAFSCHCDFDVMSLTVRNVGSKATWNCGLTNPVSRLRTRATDRPCCGDFPR